MENLKEKNFRLAIKSRNLYLPINEGMPVRVFLNTTDKCNLSCFMCPNKDLDKRMELPYSDFEKIAKQIFPYAKELHTTVTGEPLKTSYFDKIIPLLKEFDLKLNMTTNGMLLEKDISEKIIPYLNDLKISFDAAKQETFTKIRKGSNLELILTNIKSFNEVRKNYLYENPSVFRPTLTFQTTLMKDNIEELPEIVEIANQLKVDRVKAYFMVAYFKDMLNQSLWFHKELANDFLFKAEDLARRYNLEIKYPKKFEKINDVQDSQNVCHFLWQELWINTNGEVIPCCNPSAPKMGNIHKQDAMDIWNNNNFQSIRDRLNSDNPLECCKDCALIHEFKNDGWNYNYKSLIQIEDGKS